MTIVVTISFIYPTFKVTNDCVDYDWRSKINIDIFWKDNVNIFYGANPNMYNSLYPLNKKSCF
jgi:hypothetical protein